jgi:hypothetical protein
LYNKKDLLTLKQLLPEPIEINKRQYLEEILPNINNFWITDKADGIRTILWLNDTKAIWYNSVEKGEFEIPPTNDTIIECEKIDDYFYGFDIIKYQNTETYLLNFDKRLEILVKCDGILNNLIIKKFIKLNDDYPTQIANFYQTKDINYNVDGLIFTSSNDTYIETKYYKWKPVEHMSIDFVVKKCPKGLLNKHPYIIKKDCELYLLFSGTRLDDFNHLGMSRIQYYNDMFSTISNKKYFPIQFSPSDNPYAYLWWYNGDEDVNNRICELTYDIDNSEWKLLKIRTDRQNETNYYGNYFKVAEIIWRNFSNPLTLKYLCSTIEHNKKEFYFIKTNSAIHKAIRKYNNVFKFELLKKYTNTEINWCIDLGCGNGQDIIKYIKLGIKKTLFIDVNENNLCEIINRKYTLVKTYNKDFSNKWKMGIFIQKLNLLDTAKYNCDLIRDKGFPYLNEKVKLIICNFAIHYLVGDLIKLNNFAVFVSSLLQNSGRFIFTCLDGEKVYDILNETKTRCDELDIKFDGWGDGKKYKILPKFDITKKFTGIRQNIELLLPFSEGVLYTEPLVNLNKVKKAFEKNKFILESQGCFSLYLEIFKDQYPDLYSYLDKYDIEYIKLLNYSVYFKK